MDSSRLLIFFSLLDRDSSQPDDFIRKVSTLDDKVILKFDYLDDQNAIKTSTFYDIEAKDVKNTINMLFSDKIIYKGKFKIGEKMLYIRNSSRQESQSEGEEELYLFDEIGRIAGKDAIYTFMQFQIPIGPPIGGLYDALAAPLTTTGLTQLNEFDEILISCNGICNESQNAYAPFTALIQSSGFGKTKLCLESLLRHPGLYVVFRRENDNGIPAMSNWMKRFQIFVLEAMSDSLPDDSSDLNKSRVGKFLIGLEAILREYIRCFEAWETLLTSNEQTTEDRKQKIKTEVVEMIGKTFMKNPVVSTNVPSSTSSPAPSEIVFDPRFENSLGVVTLANIKVRLSSAFVQLNNIIPKNSQNFPFLLFLDELELMIPPLSLGRASAVNVVRRALHVMNTTSNFMVVAIGTNSDALSLAPAVRDDSLRFTERRNLLPSSFVSGNWDVLSDVVKYHEVILSVDDLKNCALFNVLVSFGRALWSSCGLATVIETAETKLKNGNRNSCGALLALLLVRANISVNTHHVVARNLIRSYMAIVSYISTDSHDIKIGYSSEPALAMASRSLLKDKSTRSDCLQAFAEYLEKGVIDRGRVIETLFEHVTLFAIDDASTGIALIDDPGSVPDQFKKIACCNSHLLEILESKTTDNNRKEQEITINPVAEVASSHVDESDEKSPYLEPESTQSAPIPSSFSMTSSTFNVSSASEVSFEGDENGNASSGSYSSIPKQTSQFAPLSYSGEKKRHYHVTTVGNFLEGLLGSEMFKEVETMIDKKLLAGIVNISHFVQLEKMKKDDFAGLGNLPTAKAMEKNVIDKALLVCGILRQCGFVMPPNYYGIDSIIPFVFKDEVSQESIYSFIAIQSKTSKENIFECASKMTADLHYCLCSNPRHKTSSDCSNETKCTLWDEYKKICQHQISLVLIANENLTQNVKEEVCLSIPGVDDKYDFPGNPVFTRTTRSRSKSSSGPVSTTPSQPSSTQTSQLPTSTQSPHPSSMQTSQPSSTKAKSEAVIVSPVLKYANSAWQYQDELLNCLRDGRVQELKGPYFKLEKLSSKIVGSPDAVIKKVHSSNLSIVKMIWNGEVARPSAKKPKLAVTRNLEKKHTCIICHGISTFKHLFDVRGNAILNYIIDFETSSFHNVDPLHLPMVQSSMIRGKFSPYYQINPVLLKIKGLDPLSNPTKNYSAKFTTKTWQNSVARCVLGPVDTTVDKIEPKHAEKDLFEKGVLSILQEEDTVTEGTVGTSMEEIREEESAAEVEGEEVEDVEEEMHMEE